MEVCGSAEQCSAWLKWLFVATRDHLSLQHVWPAVEALAAELMRRETISEFLRGGTRCFRGLLCGDLYPLRRFKLAVEVLQPLLRIVSPLAQFVFGLSLSSLQEVIHPLPGGLDLFFDRFGFGLQLLFNVAEGLGLEQDLEDLFALARRGGKELPELALRPVTLPRVWRTVTTSRKTYSSNSPVPHSPARNRSMRTLAAGWCASLGLWKAIRKLESTTITAAPHTESRQPPG